MKKMVFALLALILSIAATSCQKEVPQCDNVLSIKACVEKQVDGTRTSLDGNLVKWHQGDVIKVFDNAGKSTTMIADEDGDNVLFKEDLQTREEGFSQYNLAVAAYPASAASQYVDGKVRMILPEKQYWAYNSFGEGANFSVAEINDNATAVFKNVCGVLKLTFKGDAILDNIVLSSNYENDRLNGTFDVIPADKNGVPAVVDWQEGSESVTLDCKGAIVDNEERSFYFVVPAGVFANSGNEGFGVELHAFINTAEIRTIVTESNNVINRSMVKAMPVIDGIILDKAYDTSVEGYTDLKGIKIDYHNTRNGYINTNQLISNRMNISFNFAMKWTSGRMGIFNAGTNQIGTNIYVSASSPEKKGWIACFGSEAPYVDCSSLMDLSGVDANNITVTPQGLTINNELVATSTVTSDIVWAETPLVVGGPSISGTERYQAWGFPAQGVVDDYMIMYDLTITDNSTGKVIFAGRPKKETASGKSGMYDFMTGAFFRNAQSDVSDFIPVEKD